MHIHNLQAFSASGTALRNLNIFGVFSPGKSYFKITYNSNGRVSLFNQKQNIKIQHVFADSLTRLEPCYLFCFIF